MHETAALYDAAAHLDVKRVCVEDEAVCRFSHAVQRLRSSLADDATDSYWRPSLARLVRIRWELATVPLPLNHDALGLEESTSFLRARLGDCARVFPAHTEVADRVTALLAGLSASDDDPLGHAVRSLLLDYGNAFLLLRDGRHVAAVNEAFARSAGLAVLTPPQLADLPVYRAAAIIGPARWFPAHVFAAPRARRMFIAHYRWIGDDALEPRIFAGSRMGVAGVAPPLPAYAGRGAPDTVLDSGELLPVTDWAAIASGTGASTGTAERPDSVDAYLLLLASEQAIYVEAEEGSRAFVVDLGSSRELHMVPTRSIQPGTYIVARVGGEGDYIPTIADSLLGDRATRVRAAQRRWKERLRELAVTVGVQAMLGRLEAAGAERASRGNLRRWLLDSSIRTEHFPDFAALMHVAGIGDETEQMWQDMDLIDKAHSRAGQRVRALLVNEILDGDTRELEVRGWQDYDVEEIEGEGALRVARVEARHPDTLRVSSWQTRQLIPVDRDLWQG
jgi:hypothetical protein